MNHYRSEEEEGHDGWALEDLAELGVDTLTADKAYPVPSCAALIGYTHYLAGHANPVSLFGWLYVLEAMGDDLGSSIAEKINTNLGLNGKALRFVAGHGVNDIEHTADITDQLSKHIQNPDDMEEIEQAARVVGELYIRMFDEIAQG